MHSRVNTYGNLPGHGTFAFASFSIQARLLPYVEQTATYETIDFKQNLTNGGNSPCVLPAQAQAATTVITSFLCPSDGQSPRFSSNMYIRGSDATVGGTSYVVCAGSGMGTKYDLRYPSDGIVWNGSAVRFEDVTDGTSCTAMMSESLLGLDQDTVGPDPVDTKRQMADMCPHFSLNYDGPGLVGVVNPNLEELLSDATGWRGIRGSTWIWGREPYVTYTAYMLPNTAVPDMHAKGTGFFAARSCHPGGVNVLFADGGVRFIEDAIPLNVWRALSTRSGRRDHECWLVNQPMPPITFSERLPQSQKSCTKGRSMKFQRRGFISLLLFFGFFVLVVSGAVLYASPKGRVAHWTDWTMLGLDKERWESVHINIAVLTLVAAGFHLYFNWARFWGYVKKRSLWALNLKMEIVVAASIAALIVLASALVVPPCSSIMDANSNIQDYWERTSPRAPAPHAEEFRLTRLAKTIGLPVEKVIAALRQEGYAVKDGTMTVRQISDSRSVAPSDVFEAITKRYKQLKKCGGKQGSCHRKQEHGAEL